MSVRWMAVQYLGNTLRLPIVNQSDLHKPFGVSVLERDIRRITLNPLSDNPVTFVPESENERLRDYAYALEECNNQAHYCEFCPYFHYGYEYDPYCEFDFDELRAAKSNSQYGSYSYP